MMPTVREGLVTLSWPQWHLVSSGESNVDRAFALLLLVVTCLCANGARGAIANGNGDTASQVDRARCQVVAVRENRRVGDTSEGLLCNLPSNSWLARYHS